MQSIDGDIHPTPDTRFWVVGVGLKRAAIVQAADATAAIERARAMLSGSSAEALPVQRYSARLATDAESDRWRRLGRDHLLERPTEAVVPGTVIAVPVRRRRRSSGRRRRRHQKVAAACAAAFLLPVTFALAAGWSDEWTSSLRGTLLVTNKEVAAITGGSATAIRRFPPPPEANGFGKSEPSTFGPTPQNAEAGTLGGAVLKVSAEDLLLAAAMGPSGSLPSGRPNAGPGTSPSTASGESGAWGPPAGQGLNGLGARNSLPDSDAPRKASSPGEIPGSPGFGSLPRSLAAPTAFVPVSFVPSSPSGGNGAGGGNGIPFNPPGSGNGIPFNAPGPISPSPDTVPLIVATLLPADSTSPSERTTDGDPLSDPASPPTNGPQTTSVNLRDPIVLPEPATGALFAIGLAGLGFARRRRRLS